ncbi:hypothetical protein QBC35DRAFT_505044 [Podospora australis]|uniref:DHHA2 domain-containing protein n=1 Tax=Podospora australis TaxID=1536484 RepID=A0AAN7AF20_9PEZI|nr:hypothetical protein QBC35DRAFT_505044 [Podospora australis]
MASTRVSLKSFLATARKALAAPPSQRPNPLTFVVGNESADLDSLCSALLYAYFRTHTPPHTLHVPLSNLPRADLALRSELNAVFRTTSITPQDLITLSDLPSPSDLSPESTRWLLVDHNVLTGDLAKRFSSAQIIGCIDHHDDEGVIPSSCSPRLFAKCGSCMSLVIDQAKDAWSSPSETDAELARVALAPILIDTFNLTSKNKVTDWDIKAAEFAEAKRSAAPPQVFSLSSSQPNTESPSEKLEKGEAQKEEKYDRKKYFDLLTTLKDDISHLSYRDILRKDYKRWSDGGFSLGVSTIVQGLNTCFSEIGNQKELLDALKGWAQEENLDITACMTVSRPDGVFTRELLVWALNEDAVKVTKKFVEKNSRELGLEAWNGDDKSLDLEEEKEWRRCWRQTNVAHSRKQVAPMLREAMKDVAKL